MASGKLWKPGRRIPILMYHSISQIIEDVHPYYQTSTAPDVFNRHLRYLKENNYNVLRLAKAAEMLTDNQAFPKKNVVITFDDGFRDFYTDAVPILDAYGFTATVFLPTAFITHDRCEFKGASCLTWDEVRQLLKRGFTFGSHTVTHPVLSELNKHEVEHEIRFSKAVIENKTGQAVDLFSYPYAFPDNQNCFSEFLSNTLIKCGYKVGVTTRIGNAHKDDMPFKLKRIPISTHDDLKLFKAKLAGAYNWLLTPQRIYKMLKPLFRKKHVRWTATL